MNENIKRPGKLGNDAFKALIRDAPLVSIDLVVRTKAGRYLLGFRKNRPAKGSYFVLGGRIWKGETIERAFQYITEEELGVQKELGDAVFLGVFTHRYEDSYYEEPDLGTHYVVLAYELVVPEEFAPPKFQHDSYVWWTEAEILKSTDVHKETKEYFEKSHMTSESQYNVLATRRNALNTMLWQTPALSLTALAFLLNVAGNKSAYLGVRVVTCLLAFVVAAFTLQLFIRHRQMEERDSRLLEEFETNHRHLGYARINSRFKVSKIIPLLSEFLERGSRKLGQTKLAKCLLYILGNPVEWSSFQVWKALFVIFAIASLVLLGLNLRGGWKSTPDANANSPHSLLVRPEHAGPLTLILQVNTNEPPTNKTTPISRTNSVPAPIVTTTNTINVTNFVAATNTVTLTNFATVTNFVSYTNFVTFTNIITKVISNIPPPPAAPSTNATPK